MSHKLPPIPKLQVDGLAFRQWEPADIATVLEASTDPYIIATTSIPDECTEADAADYVARQPDRITQGDGYSLAISNMPGPAIGQIGLWLADMKHGIAALGYWVVPSARGKGVAAVALRTLSDWALGELGLARAQVFIEPWNTASIRTAERAGFTREGTLRSWREYAGKRRDMDVLSRVSPQ
ncbi:MAG: GNAT family N-acetyltransferase [Mycobacterium sp.]|nr:GNAT family N-acetyltransferase [Mycobacterium sp.]